MVLKAHHRKAIYVTHAGQGVGHLLYFIRRNMSPRTLEREFGHLGFRNIPDRIDYIWIEQIFVHDWCRRKGVGSRALDELFEQITRPTLIALGPADFDQSTPTGFKNVLRFYRENGFRILEHEGVTYALTLKRPRRV